jgi:hypothetical protein
VSSRTWHASALPAVVGAVIWTALVALPARHNPNSGGGPYLPALFVSALALGAFDRRSHFTAAALLVSPALILAWWTAPRGSSDDGLWVVVFPILALTVLPTAACGPERARDGWSFGNACSASRRQWLGESSSPPLFEAALGFA